MHQRNKRLRRQSNSNSPSVVEAFLACPKLPKHEWRQVFERKKEVFPTSHFKRWQLQEAKAKFSELFENALKEGPQVVTRRNKEAVVVIPEAEYRKLAEGPQKPSPGMLETLLKCPKGPGLKIHRDKSDTVLNLPRVFD